MNQQTLQKIYKQYQTKEYYNRYFNQLKLREDSRQFSQTRDTKITIRNNTVAISRGQTIVICQISTQAERVIYNSIDKSYGKPLFNINVKFPTVKGFSHRENRPLSSVQEFLTKKIQWRQIEDQITFKQTGNRYYAHICDLQIRVVSSDGYLNQACLLAVQLLLWTYKFQKIDPQNGEIKSQTFLLQIPYFLYSSKYCEIMDQLLIDPTQSQEQNSSYLITLIGDLLSDKIEQNYIMIQKVQKNCDKIPNNIIDSIKSLWKVQMSKLTFDIRDLKRRIINYDGQQQSIDLLISQ